MEYREQAEYMIKHEGGCDSIDCIECFRNGKCNGGSKGALLDAQKWLADHPEAPAKSEPIHKSATRGESSYSLSLADRRITLYHWHGQDSESMDFSGTADDLGQFDETRPEEWFDIAAKMIAGRK